MFDHLQFVQPLWFLVFMPITFLLFLLYYRKSKAVVLTGKGVIATHLAQVFSVQGSKKSSLKPILLALLVCTLLIFSLASPLLNLAADENIKAPLIIALDLSESMQAEQQSGSTDLQRAKLIMDELLQQGFNRPIALIAFAGSAHQVLPPSNQLALLRLYLGYLDPSVMPKQGDSLNPLLSNIMTIPEAQQHGFDLLIVSDGFSVDKQSFQQAIKPFDQQLLIAALNDKTAKQAADLGAEVLTGRYLDSGDNRLHKRLTQLANNKHSQQQQLSNVGYWLLYPVLLIVLTFFRRGFNLHWAALLLLWVNMMPQPAQAAFIDWWMTADQQGAYYFNQQQYKQAAESFADPNWQAAAYLYAKEYRKAAELYASQDNLTSLYNLAVANSQGRNYHRAQMLYRLLLKIEPEHHDAANNLRIITALIKEIQDTAENQQEENPPNDNSDPSDMVDEQLGADKPQIGQIAVQLDNLSVEELLGSEQKKQQWLRDISRDPKLFLGAKFQAEYLQLQSEQGNQ